MIKRLLILLPFIVLVFSAKSQNLPVLKVTQITSGGSLNFPDTIYQNQVYTLSITVTNLSNNITYVNDSSKTFTILMTADSSVFPFEIYSDSSLFTIAPGGVLTFVTTDTFPASGFKLGNNVVVVWPSVISSSSSIVADTTFFSTYYAGTSSIREYRNQQLLMYPNPFNQSVKIDFNFEQRIDFYVYDLSGRMLYQQPLEDNTLDLSFLKEGIYFMELRKQGLILSRNKMIKM